MKARTVIVEGRKFKVHELKSWPEFYRPVDARVKTYEVRRDDRNFRVRDRLWLREWDPHEKEYTGDSLVAEVTHILTRHEGLTKGFVLMVITVL